MVSKQKSKKKSKTKRSSGEAKDAKKNFLSDRQKKVLVIVVIAMFVLVPIVDNFRCKAACLKRIKTPYPEIACKYECPWPWDRK